MSIHNLYLIATHERIAIDNLVGVDTGNQLQSLFLLPLDYFTPDIIITLDLPAAAETSSGQLEDCMVPALQNSIVQRFPHMLCLHTLILC